MLMLKLAHILANGRCRDLKHADVMADEVERGRDAPRWRGNREGYGRASGLGVNLR